MKTDRITTVNSYNWCIPSQRELQMLAADAVWRQWTKTSVYAALGAAHLQQSHTLKFNILHSTFHTDIITKLPFNESWPSISEWDTRLVFAPVTLTLIRWPWYRDETWRFWSCTGTPEINFQGQGFRKLEH